MSALDDMVLAIIHRLIDTDDEAARMMQRLWSDRESLLLAASAAVSDGCREVEAHKMLVDALQKARP